MSKSRTAVATALAAPLALAMLSACGQEDQSADQTTSPTSPAPQGETINTEVKTADGRTVANANIEFADDYATVTVETTEAGILSPGFHGLHIHEWGRCEANSVAPTGGQPGDFNSAGGHLHGETPHPAIGDLGVLDVRSDGSARLVTTTDSITVDDLRGPQGSALMIHERADNFANIPDRYTVNGVPGPDAETLATGDSGARVACGVLEAASATATTTTTPTTETVTETTAVVPPPAGSPTTTTAPSPTGTTTPETTSPTTTTETSPTTTTVVTTTPTEQP
ncbi:superoxide dismutase[Cu-Zn] [Mycobacterium sp. IDR2000157661]|uniref:superoxide dismutase[Cu-Zn] n=1 Tax=Mycobacterium sp. IDR2000157661 TaxID=2867005 RepID=UPI001EEB19E8|nr:superoxide dismutase family protein [Mycobacterium sp. IDR2000157661]ULE34055.1 superoxide dismutase family protein [Mycobacterium sp. IDR2000157661]